MRPPAWHWGETLSDVGRLLLYENEGVFRLLAWEFGSEAWGGGGSRTFASTGKVGYRIYFVSFEVERVHVDGKEDTVEEFL